MFEMLKYAFTILLFIPKEMSGYSLAVSELFSIRTRMSLWPLLVIYLPYLHVELRFCIHTILISYCKGGWKTCKCLHSRAHAHTQTHTNTHIHTESLSFCSNINLGHRQPAKPYIGPLSTSHTHCFQTPWPEMTGFICPTGRVISLRMCVWEMRRAHPLISLPFPDPKDWQI